MKNRLSDFWALTKPRLMLVALLPVVLGFYLGRNGWGNDAVLVYTLLGSAFLGGGINALNQYLEKDTDNKMTRTANRPLPAGRLKDSQALCFGSLLGAGGILLLLMFVNAQTAFFGALTAFFYLFLYTPLKKVSYLNTYVGAIPGALPCVIGWAASQAPWGVRPWVLFAIFYVWQLPHFFAIAWVYREDYSHSGLKMLPTRDENGHLTSWKLILLSFSLMLLSAAPWAIGMMGERYLAGALFLGMALTAVAVLLKIRGLERAKSYVLASIVYLILLTCLMISDNRI